MVVPPIKADPETQGRREISGAPLPHWFKRAVFVAVVIALSLLIAIGSRVLLAHLTGNQWPWYLF